MNLTTSRLLGGPASSRWPKRSCPLRPSTVSKSSRLACPARTETSVQDGPKYATIEAPAAANALAIASPIPELAPVTTARCWVNELEDMDFSFLATDKGRAAAASQQPGILIAPIIPPIMRNMPSTATRASAPMIASRTTMGWVFLFMKLLFGETRHMEPACAKYSERLPEVRT